MSVFSEKASVHSVVKNTLHSNHLSFDFTPPVINNRLIFKPFKTQTLKIKNPQSIMTTDLFYISMCFSLFVTQKYRQLKSYFLPNFAHIRNNFIFKKNYQHWLWCRT